MLEIFLPKLLRCAYFYSSYNR